MIALGCITPHPPILVPEVGKENLAAIKNTKMAMEELARAVAAVKPETLVIISPHSPALADAIAVRTDEELWGSLAQFGVPSVVTQVQTDIGLAKAVVAEAKSLGLPMLELNQALTSTIGATAELDHGILVPLFYLEKSIKLPLVCLSISHLSYFKHYALGLAIQEASEKLNRRVVFVASGDLSHRLTANAPGGYEPKGKEFDLAIKDILEHRAFLELFNLDESLIMSAGECGLRSIFTLAGSLNGYEVSSEILSYEGPFGVGYLVGLFRPIKLDKKRDFWQELSKAEQTAQRRRREKESFPVRLARQTVEHYIREGKVISPPSELPDYLKRPAGVFVSIKKDKALRGCIGTTSPTETNAAQEIIHNAIQSATGDPRFLPVEAWELPDLVYSVDILEEAEEIANESFLDPKQYGVIVRSGSKGGLLLPDLEGVETVEQQVEIARRKGGISDEEPVKLYRFKVTRYC